MEQQLVGLIEFSAEYPYLFAYLSIFAAFAVLAGGANLLGWAIYGRKK